MNRKEYFELEAISGSALRALPRSPFIQIKTESDALKLGSAVDCLVTTPNEWDDEFIILDTKGPTAKMELFVNSLIKAGTINEETIECAFIESTYDVKRKKLILEQFNELWKDWTQNYIDTMSQEDKLVINPEMYNHAQIVSGSILSSEFCAPYLDGEAQFCVQWKKKVKELEFDLKGLLDIVQIDSKTILPIDIKTTSKPLNGFMQSFMQYRYDIQAALNTDGLSYMFPDKVILPYVFVVESTVKPGYPRVFKTDKTVLDIGRYGGTYNNKEYKGYEELLLDLHWYVENDKWDYPIEVYRNGGFEWLKCL